MILGTLLLCLFQSLHYIHIAFQEWAQYSTSQWLIGGRELRERSTEWLVPILACCVLSHSHFFDVPFLCLRISSQFQFTLGSLLLYYGIDKGSWMVTVSILGQVPFFLFKNHNSGPPLTLKGVLNIFFPLACRLECQNYIAQMLSPNSLQLN